MQEGCWMKCWREMYPLGIRSLIAGYARSGDVSGARKLFDSMPSRSVVSWTTMISGYSQNGRYEDALEMFMRMEKEGVRPNEVTIF